MSSSITDRSALCCSDQIFRLEEYKKYEDIIGDDADFWNWITDGKSEVTKGDNIRLVNYARTVQDTRRNIEELKFKEKPELRPEKKKTKLQIIGNFFGLKTNSKKRPY